MAVAAPWWVRSLIFWGSVLVDHDHRLRAETPVVQPERVDGEADDQDAALVQEAPVHPLLASLETHQRHHASAPQSAGAVALYKPRTQRRSMQPPLSSRQSSLRALLEADLGTYYGSRMIAGSGSRGGYDQ
eukprot:2412138-Rhodomonas_salina.3